MEVMIEEMSSKVNVADSASALGPDAMRQIVQMVLEELRQTQAADLRRAGERRLEGGVTRGR
jgi:hypothetical protein